jgi:hypothetical protein
MFFGFRNGFRIASKLVEANGDGLAKVHGAMLFASGDAQEPVAVTEVFIGKASLFGAEEKGDAAAGEMLAKAARGLFEAANRVLGLAAANGSGSDYESAVRDGLGDGLELFGAGEQGHGSDGGTRFPESQLVGAHHAKMRETEIAHGAGSGADVEGIAWLDEDDAQVVEFGMGRQGSEFTAGTKQ